MGRYNNTNVLRLWDDDSVVTSSRCGGGVHTATNIIFLDGWRHSKLSKKPNCVEGGEPQSESQSPVWKPKIQKGSICILRGGGYNAIYRIMYTGWGGGWNRVGSKQVANKSRWSSRRHTQERATATLASIVRSSVDNMDQLAVSSFFAIKNKRIRRAIFLCRWWEPDSKRGWLLLPGLPNCAERVETWLFYSTTRNLIMKFARIENIAQVARLHGSWIWYYCDGPNCPVCRRQSTVLPIVTRQK